jgi:PAS domain S-box-containing protein
MEDSLKTKTQLNGELKKMKKLIADLEAEKIEKHKVEQALRDSEKQFRRLVENSPVGIYQTMLSGRILFVNDALVNLCEFDSQEDMKSSNVIFRYKNPDDREELIRILNEEGCVSSYDFELVTKKGNTRSVLLSATLEWDQISGMIADVTKRKYVEEQLRKSETKFRSLINTAASVIIVLSPDGTITEFNSEAEKLFGVERFDAIGSNYFERFLPEQVLEAVKSDFKEVLAGKTSRGLENPIITADGSVCYLSWNVNRLLDGNSETTGIIAVGQDFTERKQNEEGLSLLLGISQKIATTIDLKELLKIAVDKTIEVTDLDRVSIVLVDEQGKGRVSAVASKDENLNHVLKEFDFKDFKLLNRALEDRKVISLSVDAEPSPLNHSELALMGKLDLSYFLIIPLLARSRVFGLMNFGFKDRRKSISNRERLFFETIANQLSAMIANARNYEETKKAEEALRSSEQQFKTLFKDSPIAMWEEDDSALKRYLDALKGRGVADFRKYFDENMEEVKSLGARRKIMRINSAALNLFRAKNKTELMENAGKVMTGDAYDHLKNWLVHTSQGRTDFELEGNLHTIHGDEIRVYTKIIIAPGSEDTLERVLVAFVDMTERLKLENELLKMQKLESIGVLAGGIAHDFNNLLTAMLGNINLAGIQSQSEDLMHKRLEEAEKAVLRAKDLTQQLLTFSTGGVPIKKAASAMQLLKDSIEFSLRGSNVKCNYFVDNDLWPVDIDEGQIGQVISNIVINADQAMPEGGTIDCHAENWEVKEDDLIPLAAGMYVRITFEDHGTGMAQEHLRKIFDPYFTTKQKGSGLGLSTSYSIISKHDGYIKADSELGRGTTIVVYLPASKEEVSIFEEDEETINQGTGKILLMDDEEVVREVAREMLDQLGFEAEFAADGEEAIRLYLDRKEAGDPFDVVIMDLTVPGQMGGREALENLLEIDPSAKSIVSSGYSNDPIMANFSEYGFKAVIKKPFTLKELGNVLHEVMGSDG